MGTAILERYRAEQAALQRPSSLTTNNAPSASQHTPQQQRGAWSPRKAPSTTNNTAYRSRQQQSSPTKRPSAGQSSTIKTPSSRSALVEEALARYTTAAPYTNNNGNPSSTMQSESLNNNTAAGASSSGRVAVTPSTTTRRGTTGQIETQLETSLKKLNEWREGDDFRIGAVRTYADLTVALEGSQLISATSRANELQAQVLFVFYSYNIIVPATNKMVNRIQ